MNDISEETMPSEEENALIILHTAAVLTCECELSKDMSEDVREVFIKRMQLFKKCRSTLQRFIDKNRYAKEADSKGDS